MPKVEEQMIAHILGIKYAGIEEIHERVAELWSYMTANQTRLINYKWAYREGRRISTARVESTVNQLVDWRMAKKQHTRWTKRLPNILQILHFNLASNRSEFYKSSRRRL
jgi:hypothetical protein